MHRITVSVEEPLVKRVDELSKETGLKVSQIFRMALEEHLRLHYTGEDEIKTRPAVIWKIKGRTAPRGPSPSLRQGRVGEYQIVSLDEISL